ncbi:hypothetical protein PybrP1_012037 [[Pythium] brassicae (nom. inval.)]|nr:hypothetical protein PybrP1_012037 [[Pythium] brassicae (nom. inval.)]
MHPNRIHRRAQQAEPVGTGTAKWRRWVSGCWSALLQFWSKVQISHRGKYSIERLQALEEYCKSASRLRVAIVCCLTPIPAFLLLLALECIPLRDPSEGWKANYPTWIRSEIVSYSVAQGLLLQVTGMIPGIPMAPATSVLVALCSSASCMALLIAITAQLVYPLPFAIVLSVMPFVIIFPIFFGLAIGRRPFLIVPNLALQLQRQLLVLFAQATLVLVYPTFNAVFMSLSLTGQLMALSLLPAVKILIKNIVARASGHLEDYIPEIVAFSVDVFNSLYVSACMQSSTRWLTTSLVMAFDAAQAVLAARDIQRRTTAVQRWNPSGMWQSPQGILSDALEVCAHPELLSATAFQKIRLRSPIKLEISERNRGVLSSLVRHRAKMRGLGSANNRRRRTSVLFSGPQTRFKSQKTLLIHQTLKMLFQCEYFILVEYIECAAPLLYAMYSTAIYYLPNAVYFPQTANLTEADVASTALYLFGYALLESLSFVAFSVVLQRRFGFSPLYLLAFVLEKQAKQVQGRLFVWIVYILPFPLKHHGVDFTFQFKWIHRSAEP